VFNFVVCKSGGSAMDQRYTRGSELDVLIVGAGMVGLSLALALGRTALKVGVIEARSLSDQAAQDDGRASAIALGSAQILDNWAFGD
jgi:2-polyprenyl-6-methoxyphenol hydroxylase-like FAD-dependent oxidoreductase